MSNPSPPTTIVPPESDSIMSSIAVVKEILSMGIPTDDQRKNWEEELNATKQLRYEETRKLEEQLEKQQEELLRLKSDLQEATSEAQRERALRITLETTNEAMQEHKNELNSQMELVTKSKEDLEGEIAKLRTKQVAEKESFSREREEFQTMCDDSNDQVKKALSTAGEWEAKFLTSQRETEELRKKLGIQPPVQHSEKRGEGKANEAEIAALSSTDATNPGTKAAEMDEEGADKQTGPRAASAKRSRGEESDKSVDELTEQLKQAHDAHKQTLDKMDELLKRLALWESDMDADQIAEQQEAEDALGLKLNTLTESYKKLSERCAQLKNTLSTDQSLSQAALQNKKRQLFHDMRKVGAVMESIQDVYKAKLKSAKIKAKNASIKFSSVREVWRVANDAVTNAQADFDKCGSRVTEIQWELEETEKAMEQKGSPTKKGKGRAKKRQKKT